MDRLSTIWKFGLSDRIKLEFFQAIAVSVLLYNCTTLTLEKWLEKNLNTNYTRMLCAVLNKSRKLYSTELVVSPFTSHLTNHPRNMSKTYWRSKNKLISDILLCTPAYGYTSVDWLVKTYIHQLCADNGCHLENLPIEMYSERKLKASVMSTYLDDVNTILAYDPNW